MADAPALRQRRYRRHKAGDHDLCVPGRCPHVTEEPPGKVERHAVTAPPAEPVDPDGGVVLGPTGRRIWEAMTAQGRPAPLQELLLVEACRIADRLDHLDALLRGEVDAWVSLEVPESGDGPAVVVVNNLISEARQQATALKTLVGELRQATKTARGSAAGTSEEGGGVLADLTARIAARSASPTG